MIKTTDLQKIKETLYNNKLCVMPTDTILGIFANANSQDAVRQIFVAKKRETSKPLAIFLPNIQEISKFGIETDMSKKFVQENLPGAYTILLQATDFAKNNLPSELIAFDDIIGGKIGIRIPMQKDILEITKDIIICGTSVNVSGNDFAKDDVPNEIEPFIDTFFTKDIKNMQQKPSTIIDFSNNKYEIVR